MKTKLVDFRFVADAFGPIPVWSLQHPKKEAADAYMVSPNNAEDHLPTQTARMRDLFKRLNDLFPYGDIYVTGEIDYEEDKDSDYRYVSDINIELIKIYPEDLLEEADPRRTLQ